MKLHKSVIKAPGYSVRFLSVVMKNTYSQPFPGSRPPKRLSYHLRVYLLLSEPAATSHPAAVSARAYTKECV